MRSSNTEVDSILQYTKVSLHPYNFCYDTDYNWYYIDIIAKLKSDNNTHIVYETFAINIQINVSFKIEHVNKDIQQK